MINIIEKNKSNENIYKNCNLDDDSLENVSFLFKNFSKIKKMGWIKSIRGGYGGIGTTFESLLGNTENTLSIPDYLGIEIKTKRNNSVSKITLFSTVPDGDYLFSLKNFYDDFGYRSKKFPQYNIFCGEFFANKNTKIGFYSQFKLGISNNEKKLRLYGTDYKKNITNNDTTWSFELLNSILIRKLNLLCIVKANSKIISGKEFFEYKTINFYKFKGFDYFIDALKNGKVSLIINIGLKLNKDGIVKISWHGCSFVISENDLIYIFDKLNLDNLLKKS